MLAKDYENAIIYLDECMELGTKVDYKLTVNSCYLNFADVYRPQKRYSEAIVTAEKSIELAKTTNSPNLLCIDYYRKGQIYYDMGELDPSLFYYQSAEELGLKQNINLRLLGIY